MIVIKCGINIDDNDELAIMKDRNAACGNHVIYAGNRYAEKKINRDGCFWRRTSLSWI